MTLRVLSTLLCTTSLVACGGGGGGGADSVQAGLVIAKGSASTVVPPLVPVSEPAAGVTPVATTDAGSTTVTKGSGSNAVLTPISAPVSAADQQVASNAPLAVITDVRLQNTTAAAQTAVPVTFGQVFAAGHLQPTDVMVGRLDDNTLVALQMDVKARHADGSVRHAIFSAIIPSLAANSTRTMALAKNGAPTGAATVLPAQLLDAGFTASATATIGGIKYTASADQLLKNGVKSTWLAGAVANEWQVSAPLTTAAGVAHPQLNARFAIRYYSGVQKARVDVTIENNWAYEPNPQNVKYNAEVIVGGQSVYAKSDLNHLHHARWRKLFWWGGSAPAVNTMLNTKYLIASKAVPNYDQSFGIAANVLTAYGNTFKTAQEPMSLGMASPYMPTTGANEGIGLLPSWTAAYILTMDQRARDATLVTGDLAGSFSSHYRDKKTDRPISPITYPYMTIVGRSTDTFNPATRAYEAFPGCGGDCTTPYTHDTAHQPNFAYVPYLVTGDYYYLEEMQFWAMYNAFSSHPGYRQNSKGLFASDQVRGQAWSLRTLAQAAYITPDADPLKSDLTSFLSSNLDWYNATYSDNASANKLGLIVNGYAYSYNGNTGIAPWQDDFFTSAVGVAAELGFSKAANLLAYKSKSPIGRMTTPGVCWIDAGVYSMIVRSSESSPVFDSYVQAQIATRGADFMNLACGGAAMAAVVNAKVGDMGGISAGYMGYPSNLQPALAYAVDSGAGNSKAAWALFMSRTVKPDYSQGAQFSIVPR
jgi:hypothetical protein